MHCFLEDRVRYCILATGIAQVEEELEDGVAACKGGGHRILKLNDELICSIECLESIFPVVDVQETFLVWIELRE